MKSRMFALALAVALFFSLSGISTYAFQEEETPVKHTKPEIIEFVHEQDPEGGIVEKGFTPDGDLMNQTTSGVGETFENGTKTAYAGAWVNLPSGAWYFGEALIGTSTSDRKTGAKSARLGTNGFIEMGFDVTNATSVSVQHAVFGTDGQSRWACWYSTDGGNNWLQLGGTVTTSSTTLQTATFTVPTTGAVRFSFDKVSTDGNRLNLDNVQITTGSTTTPPPPSGYRHLELGNPSNAQTSTGFPTNYLMLKTGYALSYHRDRRTPNWVSWNFQTSLDRGSAPRQDDFREDTTLPTGWYRVPGNAFGSPWDRGHMCPSADRTNSISANSETFLMTNMIPQAADNNQGPWAELEQYSRDLAGTTNEVHVICGSYGNQGTVSINGMTIPTRTWKIIVVLPIGTGDAARVTTATRVIAVDMPNQQGIRTTPWRNFRTTVDAIENATGLDLLRTVPTSIQSVIESRIDNQ